MLYTPTPVQLFRRGKVMGAGEVGADGAIVWFNGDR